MQSSFKERKTQNCREKGLDMRENIINGKFIIACALFLAICMIVPVWQRSVSAGLSLRINTVNSEIVALEEQRTQVKAQIERMTDSEYLRQVALASDYAYNNESNI